MAWCGVVFCHGGLVCCGTMRVSHVEELPYDLLDDFG
jgi:hypothetical protein